ncbi:GNAT family N-acetyltransferase [Catenuloplanes atrovinosus]|uniref:GNAT superfamily N-acetyltransferase n=1 Tax=Catenuloplanes atrovinosus TaxID=137266 RepID=A0AAE4C9C9_9ACTN|nr:GNAT family N-acetyltransferase [Catenuloplanes atrovinosus]MDR7275923.1 GNAT superfamily N-acetyltransferase [Catenuloplanes atrovinosus]
MTEWVMRPAVAADLDTLVELRAVVMRPGLERLGRYDEHRVRQRMRDRFVAAFTWVIEAGGTTAGCVALRPAADAHWLEHFYLAPHLQGTGIGTAVLRTLLDRADADGTVIRLTVLKDSPARRLYERHGFSYEADDPPVDEIMARWPR